MNAETCRAKVFRNYSNHLFRLVPISSLVFGLMAMGLMAMGSTAVKAQAVNDCSGGGSTLDLLAKARDILDKQKVSYQMHGNDAIEIVPIPDGPFLNSYAWDVKSKYNAEVVFSPTDLPCGASADVDPSDICHLIVDLDSDTLQNGKSTLIHEAKHLEQGAPQTNGGYDSLFFGRISNVDGTNNSFYTSFALHEISAYAAEVIWLQSHKNEIPLETYQDGMVSSLSQFYGLLLRAINVVRRYLTFLNSMQTNTRAFSVINSDGKIGVMDLSKPDSFNVIFQRINWDNAGMTTVIGLADGHDQLTIPLFGSHLDLSTSAKLIGKSAISKWPTAPLRSELANFGDRLNSLLEVLMNAKKTFNPSAPANEFEDASAAALEKVLRGGEQFKNLGLKSTGCIR